MANVFVNEDSLSDIADAIRSKLNVQTTYKPGEMAAAIESISGGSVNNQNKTVHPSSSDQSITADTGYTGLGTVSVKAVTMSNLSAANIVEGVTVKIGDADDDDRIASVTGTASSGGITPTGTKQISITQNGTTTEDVTNYASAEITVNVSGGGGGTDVTIETAATKALDCVNQIFPSRVASGHMYVAFLKNKTTSTFETDQLLGLLVFGTSSYGVGIRWRNNGFNTMAGVSNSYDARVAIGDVFETFDINYL